MSNIRGHLRAKRQTHPLRFGTLAAWSITTGIVMPVAFILVAKYLSETTSTGLMATPVLQAPLFVVGGLLGGTLIAVGQWLVLQDQVDWAKEWLYPTLVSWSCVALAWWLQYKILGGSNFKVGSGDIFSTTLIAGAIGGIVCGIVQWLILRRSVDISPLWILSTEAVWLLAALIGAVALTQLDLGLLGYAIALESVGLILGLGTGLAQYKLIGNAKVELQSTYPGSLGNFY